MIRIPAAFVLLVGVAHASFLRQTDLAPDRPLAVFAYFEDEIDEDFIDIFRRQFGSAFSFAGVDTSEDLEEAVAEVGITDVPALYVVTRDEAWSTQVHGMEGPLSAANVRAFLSSHAVKPAHPTGGLLSTATTWSKAAVESPDDFMQQCAGHPSTTCILMVLDEHRSIAHYERLMGGILRRFSPRHASFRFMWVREGPMLDMLNFPVGEGATPRLVAFDTEFQTYGVMPVDAGVSSVLMDKAAEWMQQYDIPRAVKAKRAEQAIETK